MKFDDLTWGSAELTIIGLFQGILVYKSAIRRDRTKSIWRPKSLQNTLGYSTGDFSFSNWQNRLYRSIKQIYCYQFDLTMD